MPPVSISHLSSWMSVAAMVVLFALLLVVSARRQRRGDSTQPETGRVIVT
jgi:cytochrome c-type biogenesis protein CcmH/NrfF